MEVMNLHCPQCAWSVDTEDATDAYVDLYLHEMNWPLHTLEAEIRPPEETPEAPVK